MKEFWNERYSVDDYVYGKEPNTFFSDHISQLEPGKLLLPGEGEGRNAVFAATQGWQVHAFDVSEAGQSKALRLAAELGVSIQYTLAPYLQYENHGVLFDAIGLFFTHQPAEMRAAFHARLLKMLSPGGTLIMEMFHKDQVHRNTGGPGNVDFLVNEQEVREDFGSLEILELSEKVRSLNEGPFHQGEAAVVQFAGKKKNN
jgi:hypothetical protein